MKQIIKDYKDEIKKLIDNKKYLFSIILVAILGYGYLITHTTIGMDDTCLDRYYATFFSQNMICSGRWGSYLLYRLLNITSFTPLWLEILTVSTFIITVIVISGFIAKNLNNNDIKIPIIFSTIYLSYSLINEPLIFQPSSLALMLSNLLTVISLIMLYEVMNNNLNIKNLLITIPIVAIAISMYEACCQTFAVGLLICILIKVVIHKENDRKLLKYFCVGIIILICSIILNYIILYIFYFIGVPNDLSGGRNFYWFDHGLVNGIIIVIKNILHYTVNNTNYFPVFEFVVLVLVGLIISIYYSVKNKNINIFNIYIITTLANFALAILQCKEILYRTCISWGLFVATVITVTYYILSNKRYLRGISTIFVVLIILWQTRDLNQWFYSEYIKYQRDLKDAYQIAYDIEREVDDLSKPVVFIGIPDKGFQTAGQRGAQSNGLSVIWWGEKAFDDNSYELIKFINSLGYNYLKPTDEQCRKGRELSENMSNYPKDGYIKEFGDIIVVKFN